MIKNKDIIITGLQGWDSKIGSNAINIALEFSKQNRVLYVNYPLDRLTAIKQKNNPVIIKRKKINKGLAQDIIKINENLWTFYPRTILESINQIKPDFVFDYLNKINNKRYAKQIKAAIKRLNFKDYILFNDSDFYRSFYLKEMLKPQLYVYYIRDNLIVCDYYKKHGHEYEKKLIEKADIIVTNSSYLADYAKQFNKNSFDVGQGCDLKKFNIDLIKKMPSDIKDIKKPVIGYAGALKSLRLNINLLIHIAKVKPEWNIVLVGPEDDNFKNSKLHELKNVYFLGNKKPDEIPAYIAAFDVAINPQILNEITIGNYPRKIDEYLSMGKPVVATKTKTMEKFSEHCYLAKNNDEYIYFIEKALNENSPEKEKAREKFAGTHTWENNVSEIYKRINKFINKL